MYKKKTVSEIRRMTKAALLEHRSLVADRRTEILASLDKEGEERELTEEEVTELEALRNQQAMIQARIDELEAKEQQQAEDDRNVVEEEEGIEDPALRGRIRVGESRSLRNPITQLIRGAMTGVMSDEVRRIADRGRKAHRNANLLADSRGVYIPIETRDTLQATVETQGKEGVATDLLNILDPIRDNLVVAKAGATILSNLVGNLEIPTYSGTTSSWEGETTKAKDGAGKFSKKKLSPKRLATTLNVSKQLLLQDSAGIEAMLKRDIVASIYTKLEETMFSNKAANGNIPRGLFRIKTQNAAIKNYDGIVDLYTKLRKNLYGGQNIKAVTNPMGYGMLAKTPIRENVAQGFLVDGDMLAIGMEILQTTAVEHGIMMADFTQLILGQWGALELKIDDTTRFDEGIVRIMVNSYWDYDFRDEKAFEVAPLGEYTPTPTDPTTDPTTDPDAEVGGDY